MTSLFTRQSEVFHQVLYVYAVRFCTVCEIFTWNYNSQSWIEFHSVYVSYLLMVELTLL